MSDSNARSLEESIVRHLVNTKYEDLPFDAVQYCKLLVMDSLGVVFPGRTAPGCQEVVKLARMWGGDSGASLLICGNKTFPPMAALANSTMMHALDFDDTLDASALHTFVSVLPAALATAEASGERVSGKQFITALILGVDVVCRLSLAIRRPRSWIRTATCGSFGSAATAGKLLNLNHDHMSNALGIVYGQTSGNAQGLLEGRLVKRMQPGFAASAGVLSAFLARGGITGSGSFLEGPYGFYRLYERDEYDVGPVIDGLGKHFLIMDLSIKPYPCCRMTHASIDAALQLRERITARREEIREVTVDASDMVAQMVGKPFVIGTNPQVDAQFSIPYTTAVALCQGRVFLDDFTASAVCDVKRKAVADRVRVNVDPSLPAKDLFHSRMTIRTTGGGLYESAVDVPLGNPANPMSVEQCRNKFERCLSYSGVNLPPGRVRTLLSTIESLETVDDIRVLSELMRSAD
jgi:2-methylcitrate dehydratase PrpD